MGELGGATSGLPFYAFLESSGKKIADSMVEGPNRRPSGIPDPTKRSRFSGSS